MPKYILHLVTIHHPEVFTRLAGLGEPKDLPFWRRSRAVLNDRFSQFATERGLRGTRRRLPDGQFTTDLGEPVKGVRGKCLRGIALSPVSYEPRLVYYPDERHSRARWRIEFRNDWEREEGILEDSSRESLRRVITSVDLKVNAAWLNKAYFDAPERERIEVNLMLGPFPREEEKQFIKMPISLEADTLYIEI